MALLLPSLIVLVILIGCGGGSGSSGGPDNGGQPTPAFTKYPYTTLGGAILRGYYDSQRQLLFTSNIYLNEVDVVSTVDMTVKKRIHIPQPVGIDQMPDRKRIVVGTKTQGIYFVDEDTFSVEENFVPAPDLGFPYATSVFPVIPRVDSVDFIDLASGTLRARLALPERLLGPQSVAVLSHLALDNTGQTLFAISASGLTIVQFDDPIDTIPTAVWPF
jgi:hypothetical protein